MTTLLLNANFLTSSLNLTVKYAVDAHVHRIQGADDNDDDNDDDESLHAGGFL